jgi:hypothetical protein
MARKLKISVRGKRRLVPVHELDRLAERDTHLDRTLHTVQDRTGTVAVAGELPYETVDRAIAAEQALLEGARTQIKRLQNEAADMRDMMGKFATRIDEALVANVSLHQARSILEKQLAKANRIGSLAIGAAVLGWLAAGITCAMLAVDG